MARWWDVLKESIRAEREAGPRPERGRDEREFLPAALEILETPANPAGRAVLWLIVVFFAAALIWASIGQVDIHATAQGRIVPAGKVKVIEPLETGTVEEVAVEDGDRVRAGQVLLRLDATEARADRERLARELATATVQLARLDAQSLSIEANLSPPDAAFEPLSDAEASIVEGQRQVLLSKLAAYRAEQAAIDGEIAQAATERKSGLATFKRQEAMVTALREMVEQRQDLLNRGSGSRAQFLETAQHLYEEEANLARAEGQWRAAAARIDALRGRKTERRAAALAEAATEREEVRQRIAALGDEFKKAALREKRMVLTAPVDGTVLQLTVNTLGEVVETGERLMIVVPDDVGLEVEAMLLNKDKGFVARGNEAAVKLEAFPFTKYGTIPAEVTLVSNDAVEQEGRGLVFPTRVALKQEWIRADGEDVSLSPGMAVTVEVKTGSRRVIEYLLTPLLRYRDEALRER